MNLNIVGISCCGITCAEEIFNRSICQWQNYINCYRYGETEFPFCNLVVTVKFIHNSACYLIQIVPTSPHNEYTIISGTNYSLFKVKDKSTNIYQLLWNGQIYNIILTKNLNTFQVTINEDYVMSIEQTNDPLLQSCILEFPTNVNVQSDEINANLDECFSQFNHILQGYSLPEPFFLTNLCSSLKMFFKILRDPMLPSLQFQAFFDVNGALLPDTIVNVLQQIIAQYTSNISSLFSQFPSNQIKLVVDNFISSIEDNSAKLSMIVTLRPVLELAEMYSSGIRGNAKNVIEKLLIDFLKVEIKFQDEETILNSHLISNELTIEDFISHNNIGNKTKFIVTLFEYLDKYLSGIILDLKNTIQKLLSGFCGNHYSQLIPKLREVLITGQMPSYEVRKNEMEAIFLSSINGGSNAVQTNRLETLICSNSDVFDIISDFFYHKIIEIRKCAMEVYVRRAYMIYEICSFEQSQLANGQLCVLFKFSLPLQHNCQKNITGQKIKRSNSFAALTIRNTPSLRKFSQISRNQLSGGYVEKYEISDDESPNEDLPDPRQNDNDNDTDSAICVDAFSLSDFNGVSSDCLLDNNVIKQQQSPSTHSLDRYMVSSNFSTFKQTSDNIKASDGSLDKIKACRHNRHASMFCKKPPLLQVQDFTGQCHLGLMIIVDTMDEIENILPAIQNLLLIRNSTMDGMDYLEYDRTALNTDNSPSFQVILKLILRDPQLMAKSDDDVSLVFYNFCDKHLSFFNEICVPRITFLLQSVDKTIRYFTFRNRDKFEEDKKLRNIDPIMSFQLEINRLRNYRLERLPVPNRRIYIYMGTCKEMTTSLTAEYRMFARCIIHHKDFNSSTSNIEYMGKEAERNLMESMDAFDMAWIDRRANWTKSNHIFFYFQSILCINKIEELENVVRTIIFKNGRRLWSLRITQAELKMSVKVANEPQIPIRLWVHNEGGKSLDICIYREEYQFKTDQQVLVSWSSDKLGRYHGVPVDCFYSI